MANTDSRKRVLADILVAIEKAKREGGQIAVGDVASSILERYPDIDMSLPDLESEVARLAVAHGIKNIEFGPPVRD